MVPDRHSSADPRAGLHEAHLFRREGAQIRAPQPQGSLMAEIELEASACLHRMAENAGKAVDALEVQYQTVLSSEVNDLIVTIAGNEAEGIGAATAPEPVVAGPPSDDVVPGTAIDPVVAFAAIDHVPAAPCQG